MGSTNQFNGVMAALPHVADIRYPHREKYDRLDAFGIFHDAFLIEHTFKPDITMGQRLQNIVWLELVNHGPGGDIAGKNALDLMPAGVDSEIQWLIGKFIRQPGRH